MTDCHVVRTGDRCQGEDGSPSRPRPWRSAVGVPLGSTVAIAVLLALVLALSGGSILTADLASAEPSGPDGESVGGAVTNATYGMNVSAQPTVAESPIPPEPANVTPETESDRAHLVDDEAFDADGFDPATVLERVEELRGLNATDEIVVRELDSTPRPDNPNSLLGVRTEGAKLLGFYSEDADVTGDPVGLATQEDEQVVVYVQPAEFFEETDNLSREVVLAHEFAHALQFQHGLIADPAHTTDAELARHAVVEGDAMIVTEQYRERYGQDDHHSVDAFGEPLPREQWTASLIRVPYLLGYEYFERTNASLDERDAVLEEPPKTTSHLLDPDDPAPEIDESVRDDGSLDGPGEDGRIVVSEDRVGQLTIEHAFLLQNRSETRAAAAADGWVDDHMTYYFEDDELVHWEIQWASNEDASAFATEWQVLLLDRGGEVANGTIAVPDDEAPTVHYAVDREGDLVRIVSSTNATETRALAEETFEGTGAERLDDDNESDRGTISVDPDRGSDRAGSLAIERLSG